MEKNEIRVSVIVPVYNAEDVVGECLDGILGQTLREIEVICVDDGSSDGSLSALEDYQKKDGRVRVIHQENQGAGVARNTGMKEARGDFLVFLDSDDRFEKELLETGWKLCVETGADVCAWGADSFDTNTGTVTTYSAAFDRRLVPQQNPFDPASRETRDTVMLMFNGVPWSKMFRASFIRQTGLQFQALRTTNDAFFVYSAICQARKIVTLDRVLVHRRTNDGKSLTQTRELSWQCFYEALKGIRDELERKGLLETFERAFANRALKNIFWNIDTVSPACAEEITQLMKTEGFSRLGIDRLGAEDYLDASLYERYTWLRDLDPAGYRTVWEVAKERNALRAENQKLKKEVKRLKETKNPQTPESRLKAELRKIRARVGGSRG